MASLVVPPLTVTPISDSDIELPTVQISDHDEDEISKRDEKEEQTSFIKKQETPKDLLSVPQHSFIPRKLSRSLSIFSGLSMIDSEDEYEKSIFSSCEKAKLCTLTLYSWLGLLTIGSAVTLVVVGVLLVDPWVEASRFVSSTCIADNLRLKGERKCTCGKSCASTYLCIHLEVKFIDHRNSPKRAILKENEVNLVNEVRHCKTINLIMGSR
ncbi:unnamed protein product [Dimorphilus gyrociliatus]|uniref:Uncharacterized protein n=1 Tax=Dimorphilus gyrociliatus TaxID=2664684 RepID=A0A7I8WCC3_9ANNE|nr:unnamed protein product [Dimorphilus gyrociliatus]